MSIFIEFEKLELYLFQKRTILKLKRLQFFSVFLLNDIKGTYIPEGYLYGSSSGMNKDNLGI